MYGHLTCESCGLKSFSALYFVISHHGHQSLHKPCIIGKGFVLSFDCFLNIFESQMFAISWSDKWQFVKRNSLYSESQMFTISCSDKWQFVKCNNIYSDMLSET